MEKYTEAEYIKLILSEYQEDNIKTIDIPFVQTHQGITDYLGLDHLFFLEVTFDHTVNNKEAFADGVEAILLALSRTGLSNCDTLEAFANIGNQTMHIQISPRDMLTSKDIVNQITEFPISDE